MSATTGITYKCKGIESLLPILKSWYLMPHGTPSALGYSEKEQIRRDAGHERASREFPPEDFALRGLTQLLEFLPKLSRKEAAIRARVLWEALADLESRGTAAFYGSYQWSFFRETKTARFDAFFIRMLNQAAWVPNSDGELVPPGLVVFETLGWKPNQFLLTKIAFKPPIIDQLAKEAGIDPAALDLLRRLGITNVAELTARLGIADPPSVGQGAPEEETDDAEAPGDVYDDARDLYGADMPDIPPGKPDPDGGDGTTGDTGRGGQTRSGSGTQHNGSQGNGGGRGGAGGMGTGRKGGVSGGGQGKRSPGHSGTNPFVSYVAVHSDDEEPDPDGLDQAARMQIEEQAIALITSLEPALQRTPDGNPGFDLYETNDKGQIVRWVEVKSMTRSMKERPVGLSRTQFDCAREKGDGYWLYVVEFATEPGKARVLRIQNPFAQARTFTFDHGWSQIAQGEPPPPTQFD